MVIGLGAALMGVSRPQVEGLTHLNITTGGGIVTMIYKRKKSGLEVRSGT